MNDKKKRQRGANFTKHEENIAFSIILKHKNIVENKKTDAVSIEDKKKAWQKIISEFNAISPNNCERAVESLKKMYENRKKELRKDKASERQQLLLTGGGPVIKIDESQDLLLSIVNEKSIFGEEPFMDSDSVPLHTEVGAPQVHILELSNNQVKITIINFGLHYSDKYLLGAI